MSDDKEARARRIEEAAYKVLEEKGFKGASMLAVARAAKASNETLYNWYGDKVGLFSALVQRNTALVLAGLTAVRSKDSRGAEALEAVSQELLEMVTGARAVALNRAAAADMTGTLGKAVAAGGRDVVAPLLAELIGEAQADGAIGQGDTREITETYVALLLGDIQIRRAIGVASPLTKKEATARVLRAVAHIKRLYPA